jgi:hypothetical protein
VPFFQFRRSAVNHGLSCIASIAFLAFAARALKAVTIGDAHQPERVSDRRVARCDGA